MTGVVAAVVVGVVVAPKFAMQQASGYVALRVPNDAFLTGATP
jgi:hypothetical protein